MATALYLEHYLDSLESLPMELQRNFTLMRDLDSRAQDLLRQIDQLAEDYIRTVRVMEAEGRGESMAKIQRLFNKAKEYGDDKVQLAIQTYELVDKHIRRLDSDLARFEAEVKDKALGSRPADTDALPPKKGRKKGEREKKKGRTASSDDEAPRKKQKKKGAGSPAAATSDILNMNITHPSDVLDMPVDPNEPTYCLCHQVSYGEMIGCDNPDCPIEWFHFACVGLTTKPKGKWFCPKCSADRKKK